MDQEYKNVLKRTDPLHEDQVSSLCISVVKMFTHTKIQELYTTNKDGNVTTNREHRVQTITNCIENAQKLISPGNESQASKCGTYDVFCGLKPRQIGILVDYYFTIFTGPDVKTAFDNFLEMTANQSDEKLVAEVKYLLMAFTSTKFKTEDFTSIYNNIRLHHKGKFKVIVRSQGERRSNVVFVRMGLALLINIKEFDDPLIENREGSEHDVTNLKILLHQLDCVIWKEEYACKEKWTNEELKDHIKKFRDKCDKVKPKYIFVYIGSHGKEGYIATTDSTTTTKTADIWEDITDLFHDNDQENPIGAYNLKNIPKVLFINSCRFPAKNESKSRSKFPTASNLVIIRSQAYGCEAYRNDQYGTWGAHCFVFVVMNLAYKKPFVELMEEVKKIFERLEISKEETKDVKYGHKFETEWISSLPHDFRLEPRYVNKLTCAVL